MTVTYDPIREVTEVQRLRIGSPIRPPEMGDALVLTRPVGDPLVIEHGERVPDPRIGNYRMLYRIDVANRGLEFTASVPSADPAFPFEVTIRFGCRVTDPVAIARDNVRDMTAGLAPSLTSVAEEVTTGFDIMESASAARAIAKRLNTAFPTATVVLTGFVVSARPVDVGEIITAHRDLRVQRMRREAMRPVAAGDAADMLAHVMAINDGDPMPYIDRERQDQELRTQAQLDALKTLLGSNEPLEGFNKTKITEQAVESFFPNEKSIAPATGGYRERLKKRDRTPIESGSPVVEEAEPAARPEEVRRSSRVRGTAKGASRPKPDR